MQRLPVVVLVAIVSSLVSSLVVAGCARDDPGREQGDQRLLRRGRRQRADHRQPERGLQEQRAADRLEPVRRERARGDHHDQPGRRQHGPDRQRPVPGRKKVIGGGHHLTGGSEPHVYQSFPQTTGGNAQSWQLGVFVGPSPITISAYAVCAQFVP